MRRTATSIAGPAPALLAVALLALLVLAVPRAAHPGGDPFHFTSLNVPFSNPILGYSTVATGINDAEQIVGSFAGDCLPDGYCSSRGFVYDHGVYTAFDASTAFYAYGALFPPQTQPSGINNLGQIVGVYQDDDPYWGVVLRGFLYDHGTVTTLTPPDASTLEVQARGINDRGKIVGFYFDNNIIVHAFLYDHGRYTAFDVPGAVDTRFMGINNQGQIVGMYYDSVWKAHVFLYDHGHVTTLDDPAANYLDPYSNPPAINDRGQIVGSSFDASFLSHGFVYDQGHYTHFDAPNGGNSYSGTFPQGINARGEIVGFAFGKGGPPAFLLRMSGGDY